MFKSDEVKDHLRLAIPMAFSQLAQIALNVVDTVMCGQLGGKALAGAGLGFATWATVWVPMIGVMLAVAPLTSQAFGANDHTSIGRIVRHALWLGACLGMVAMWILRNVMPFYAWMGQDLVISQIAQSYLNAAIWSAIPALWVIALRGFLESMNRPNVGMVITILGIGVNIVGNWILMYGKYGFPALGVAGTGWATTIVNSMMVAAMLLYILYDEELSRYHNWSELFSLQMRYFKELLRVGLPITGTICAEAWLFTASHFLMGKFSQTALAAHQIAINISSVTFMFAMGIANASTVRVGMAIGAGDVEAAKRAGKLGMLLGMASMGLLGSIFIIAPQFVIGFYLDTHDPNNLQVVQLAGSLLTMSAMFQLFDGLQITSQGALRGLKDTTRAMIIAIVTYWGIGFTSGIYFAFIQEWHEIGLWMGLILGLAAASAAFSYRFFSHFRHPDALLQYHSIEES